MPGAAHSHADEKKCRVVGAGLIQDERDEHRVSYRVFFKRSRHRRLSLLPNQVVPEARARRKRQDAMQAGLLGACCANTADGIKNTFPLSVGLAVSGGPSSCDE
jgi:hypothetical protein